METIYLDVQLTNKMFRDLKRFNETICSVNSEKTKKAVIPKQESSLYGIVCLNSQKPAVDRFRVNQKGIYRYSNLNDTYERIFAWFEIQNTYDTPQYFYFYSGEKNVLVLPKSVLTKKDIILISSLI